MTIKKLLLFCVLLSVAGTSYGLDRSRQVDAPKRRAVEIKPITELVVDVLPTRGVKFIFPWVLDEESDELPFDYRVIDGDSFDLITTPGQNHFTVNVKHADEVEGRVTDLFVNTGGYHFTITLRVNYSRAAHYSSVVFELGDEARMALINDAIRKRTEVLQREFERKEQDLDKRAERLALKYVGYLAQDDYDEQNIREEGETELNNGDVISLYVDKVMRFGKFAVVVFEIENESKLEALYIQDIRLFVMDSQGQYRPSEIFHETKPKVQKNETVKGFMVTTDLRIIDDVNAKATLMTDRGNVEVEW
jgi:hypothetical protein